MNTSEIWSGWYQGGKAAYLRPLRKIGTPPPKKPKSRTAPSELVWQTLLHSAILWPSQEKSPFHASGQTWTRKAVPLLWCLLHFSLSLFTAASLLLKPKLSPGYGFNLWINYDLSSSEPTRERGGWHRKNERVLSSSLFYSLFYEVCSCAETAESISYTTMSKSLYDSLLFGKERTKENAKYSCFGDGKDMQMTKTIMDPSSHTVLLAPQI